MEATEAVPSLLLLAGTVLLCEAARRIVKEDGGVLAWEAVCVFQLCACTHELWLLAVIGRAPPALCLGLTYLMTLVYCWTCTGALLNPTAALQQLLTGCASLAATVRLLGAQLLAAGSARLWSLGLRALPVSVLHGRAFASGCSSSLQTGVWMGLQVELACAFAVSCTLRQLSAAPPWQRPHLLAMLITALVYAVGDLTGALFNPALAFSINFFCKGSSLLDNIFVYWLGPIAGMILSVILFDQMIPTLRRMLRRDDAAFEKMD